MPFAVTPNPTVKSRTRRRTWQALYIGSLALTPLAAGVANAAVANAAVANAAVANVCEAVPSWSCVWENNTWACRGRYPVNPITAAPIPPETPVTGQAARVTSEDGVIAKLEGSVQLRRGAQELAADQVSYNPETQQVAASGEVRLSDLRTEIYAESMTGNLAANRADARNVRYALKDGRGNGTASDAQMGKDRSRLNDVTFTSCPAEKPAWQLKAASIELDHEAKVGYAKQVRVQVGNVPILYLPYLSFPLTDERKSGVLAPSLGYGDEGLDVTVPYYLNLAPNYDATLYPRWLSERGAALGLELRHLGTHGQTQFTGAYLPNDKKTSEARSAARLLHHSWWGGFTSLSADLNYVSDDRYFDDLGDSLSTSATSVIPRIVQFSARGLGWNAGLMADDYEVIDPTNPFSPDPYRRLPRAFAQIERFAGPLQFGLNSEWVRFDRDSFCLEGQALRSDLPAASGAIAASFGVTPKATTCTRFDPVTGSRFDLMPSIGLPIERSYGFLRPELAWRYTSYQLDRQGLARNADRSPRRSLPIASVDAGLYFERDGAFGRNWRQTLEPRLYYLRVPERDQSALPLFDSNELDFSFPQLFRTNRFTGADRQADANQITVAVQSALQDSASGREWARVAIGSIWYLDSANVALDIDTGSGLSSRTQSVWVAEAQATLDDRWELSAGVQYDPELSKTRLAAARLQRKIGARGVLNLGYRYRVDRIRQMDLSGFVPLDDNWSLIGRWNFSFDDDQTLEALGGFEYRACCFAVRFIGRRYLRAASLSPNNGLYLEIELDGLGSVGRKTSDILSRAIFGFSEPERSN